MAVTFKLTKKNTKQTGFTLIEVMLVILLIGVFVSAVTFSSRNTLVDKLEQASDRFTGIFNIAAEYSLLNNLELGLLVEDNSYQFVAYDSENFLWLPIEGQAAFEPKAHEDIIQLTLELDGLPIDESSLIDEEEDSLFEEDDELFEEDEEEKIIPQVLLLSSGDFTSFNLRFSFVDEIASEREIEMHVAGLFTLPLNIIGPLYDGESFDLETLNDDEN